MVYGVRSFPPRRAAATAIGAIAVLSVAMLSACSAGTAAADGRVSVVAGENV